VAVLALLTALSSPAVSGATAAQVTAIQSSQSQVTIHGSGFASLSPVNVSIAFSACNGAGTAATNFVGSFSFVFSIVPECVGLGTATASDGQRNASADIDLVRNQAQHLGTSTVVQNQQSSNVTASGLAQIGWITGENSPNRTMTRFGVAATDLGVMWDRGDGTVLVAFGDTFGAGWGGSGAGPGNADWRSNFITTSSTTNLDEGLALDLAGGGNRAEAVLPPAPGEVTVIPTTGIAIDGRQYMHYMAVTHWGEPGRWTTSHSGVATSDDNGTTWARPNEARIANPDGNSQFQLLSYAVGPDGELYGFGTPHGRFGSVHLAHIAGTPDDISSWTYWNGSDWSANAGDAAVVAEGPAGEPSVGWHAGIGKWVMLYLNEHKAEIVLRTADSAIGPWSEESTVVSGTEYPALYGAFIHPASLEAGSNSLYFTMTQWDPYNVMLMKAQLG